jgi:hypothetical protein
MNFRLIKIREGKETVWIDWCNKVQNEFYNEALESIKEENVVQETIVKVEINNRLYCLAYMEGECLPANMNREINRIHAEKKKECIESVDTPEILYNIKQK